VVRKLLTAFLAVALTAAGLTTLAAPSANAAVPNTIPLTYTNNSGRSDPIYIYDIGTLLSTGQQGWADANGTFHPWPAGANPPSPAPDASIAGPANGQSITIQIPQFSGRIYFSFGQKLVFSLATGGLVQPAVQNPTDPNHNILFDWTEYTLNGSGLWINSTQVDMFAIPYTVGATDVDGSTQTTGTLKPGGYDAFFNALRNQPGGWANLIQTSSDGTILRALAPSHGIETGALPSTVMDDYVNRVWAKYSTSTLTVTPFADQPNTKYYGRVSGNTMNFTDSTGAVVTSFQKPDSDSIFSCDNLLDAPNDLVRGPISRTLCAAYNRTTLLTNPNQPDTSSAGFYQDPVTNYYAQALHAQMADGNAYAFAFDDVGNHESLVQDSNPQGASITLNPFDGSGSTPTGPVSTTAWYELVNSNSGQCVDASGAGTTNGTPILQWPCAGQSNQQWQFTPTDSGYYTITNRNAAGNQQVIDVPASSTADGTDLDTWGLNSGANQQWLPVLQSDGSYHLVSRNSGKCLDVTGASTTNGTLLEQWTCNGGSNQSFQLSGS
jgi:Beta-1,3-glucanase/Ricin-type beta-trefoil lectin domain-like